MPNVNGMKFPYTPSGKEAAKKAVAMTMAKKKKKFAKAATKPARPGAATKPVAKRSVPATPIETATQSGMSY